MKILHIGADSHFLQYLGEKFEAVAPGANVFVVISREKAARFPIPAATNVVVRSGVLDFIARILPAAFRADAIVAHGLSREAAALMALLVKPIKIWSGWGADYYRRGFPAEDKLLAPLTAQYSRCGQEAVKLSASRRAAIKAGWWLKRRAVRSVDYFSAPIPTDFDVMAKTFPEFTGEYLQLNYGDVETMFSAGVVQGIGNNVLVGNSSSMTNNHEDLFARLAECDMAGRSVITPLSYGDAAYRSFVIKRGRHYFGEAFLPLVEQMPLQQYVSLISSCNVVLMGHRRQQALGNIGVAIFQGANVFLDGECPTYEFLKSRGIAVYTLDELGMALPTGRREGVALEKDREALEGFWGQDVVVENVANCISRITGLLAVRARSR